jgi:hypothetical protein
VIISGFPESMKGKKTGYAVVLIVAICLFLSAGPARVSAATQCSDGIDNDFDGLTDAQDPGCASGTEEFNVGPPPAPVNGLVAGGLMWYPVTALGSNLLVNPSFEEINASTGKPIGWSGSAAFSLDTTVARTGANSFRMKDAPAFPYSESATQKIAVKKGTYRIGGWVKMDNISGAGKGIRLGFGAAWSQPGGGGSTNTVNGTSDWQYLEQKTIVITQDIDAYFTLGVYAEPNGTAWYDDLELREEIQPAVQAFLLYPNFKGFLFDDQSQTVRFDVSVYPPSGSAISDYNVVMTIMDEGSGAIIQENAFLAAGNFNATFDGSQLVNGRTYLARFRLLRLSDSAFLYEYPPYRISKVQGSLRNSMTVSFDENNRILFRGQPSFILGVYDSGLGYTTSESGWNSTFTNSRRLFELPINFYNNYWYGGASVTSMNVMSKVLQDHGIYFIHTGNCFGSSFSALSFPIHANDSYLVGMSNISGMAGFYLMDECAAELVPSVFGAYKRLSSFKPDGISFAAGNTPGSMKNWRDSMDLMSMDPYPMYGAEPAGGYKFNTVADWTAATKDAVKDSRPVATVIQFFKFTSQGRWPTQDELRKMSYTAITEGANGLVYWSIGVNALAYICDGSSAYYSPSGSGSWCQAKIDNFQNLKNVMWELKGLEPALTSIDMPDLLTGNSNPAIHTRVKFVNGTGYMISYNYNDETESTTFTWSQQVTNVFVYNESRTITPAGNSFSDSFGPYEAHVYNIAGTTPPASDTTPPAISSVTSSAIAQSGATVTWMTNEAADSQVDYGMTTSYGSSTMLNTTMTTSHSQSLQGLSSSTTYHYRARSGDAAGNLATSGDYTFTTPAAPAGCTDECMARQSQCSGNYSQACGNYDADNCTEWGDNTLCQYGCEVGACKPQTPASLLITGVNAVPGRTTAAISWTTSEAANSSVSYGIAASLGTLASDASMAASHSLSLDGLSETTLYYYAVKSCAASGACNTSETRNFTTTFAPDTNPPSVVITAPSDGVNVNGITVISVNASDNAGVGYVEFYRDGTLIHTDYTSPYAHAWDTSGEANGQHTILSRAVDAAGNPATNAITVIVNNVPPGSSAPSGSPSPSGPSLPPDRTPPTAPSSFFAAGVSSSTANLTWSASSDNVGVIGYRVYRNGVFVGTSKTDSFEDSGLSPGTTYRYTISAYDAENNPSNSSALSVTTAALEAPLSGTGGLEGETNQPLMAGEENGNFTQKTGLLETIFSAAVGYPAQYAAFFAAFVIIIISLLMLHGHRSGKRKAGRKAPEKPGSEEPAEAKPENSHTKAIGDDEVRRNLEYLIANGEKAVAERRQDEAERIYSQIRELYDRIDPKLKNELYEETIRIMRIYNAITRR